VELRVPAMIPPSMATLLKLFASHTLGFVTGDMNVARDVEGRKQGTLGQANLWLTAPRSNILRQHRARHDLG